MDFHFGATYAVARLAGFDHEQAEIIATSSQYVDDTVNSGALQFKTGQSFYRISTAHELHDYHIALPVEERRTWVPFHFLPGNDPEGDHNIEFYNRVVCRPNSPVAQAMVRSCIEGQEAPHALHRLGITAHVFIDTWAHQGFAGIKHPINRASGITLLDPDQKSLHLKELFDHGGLQALWARFAAEVMRLAVDEVFPMGHGAVLHYPDHPFRRWRYTNGHGATIERDNPTDFLTALEELHIVFGRYLARNASASVQALKHGDRDLMAGKIRSLTQNNPTVRLRAWTESIEAGEFSFGGAQPTYARAGPGSWKHQALGIEGAEVKKGEQFDYNPEFERSNWKLFHDAAQAHQTAVLQQILPSFGIRAI